MIRIAAVLAFALSAGSAAQDMTLDDALNYRAISKAIVPDSLTTRENAVVMEAKKLGLAGGYAEYRRSVAAALDKHSTKLDAVFDFAHVLVRTDGGSLVLPPVVEEYGPQTQILDNGRAMREIDARLVIEKPARLIAQVPSWKQYLAIPKHTGAPSDRRGWPKDEMEQRLWQDALTAAWSRGRANAAQLYELRFSQLEKDYVGMLRYLEYVNRGMLKEIYVAGNELGILVENEGQAMRVGGRFVRISRPAQFDGDAANWEPVSIPIDWEVFDDPAS